MREPENKNLGVITATLKVHFLEGSSEDRIAYIFNKLSVQAHQMCASDKDVAALLGSTVEILK